MIVNIFLPGSNTRTKKNSKGSEVKVDYGAEEAGEETKEEEVKTVFKLAEEDVEFIYDNTHYTLKDIKEWHKSATTLISQFRDDSLKYFSEDLPKIVPMEDCTDRR